MSEYCDTCGHEVTNDRTKHLRCWVDYDENGDMEEEYCNDTDRCGEVCNCADSAINKDRKKESGE